MVPFHNELRRLWHWRPGFARYAGELARDWMVLFDQVLPPHSSAQLFPCWQGGSATLLLMEIDLTAIPAVSVALLQDMPFSKLAEQPLCPLLILTGLCRGWKPQASPCLAAETACPRRGTVTDYRRLGKETWPHLLLDRSQTIAEISFTALHTGSTATGKSRLLLAWCHMMAGYWKMLGKREQHFVVTILRPRTVRIYQNDVLSNTGKVYSLDRSRPQCFSVCRLTLTRRFKQPLLTANLLAQVPCIFVFAPSSGGV